MKAFDVKDGYGIVYVLPELGIIPIIFIGSESMIFENRAK